MAIHIETTDGEIRVIKSEIETLRDKAKEILEGEGFQVTPYEYKVRMTTPEALKEIIGEAETLIIPRNAFKVSTDDGPVFYLDVDSMFFRISTAEDMDKTVIYTSTTDQLDRTLTLVSGIVKATKAAIEGKATE